MLPSTQPSLLAGLNQTLTRAEAFERFCRLYTPGLLACCRSEGLQHADAEDVTQRILVRLWDALRRFDYDPERGTLRGYLARVVHNAVTDWRREQARHPRPEASEAVLETPTGHSAPADSDTDALASAVQSSAGAAEWEAIARVQARVDPQTWKCFFLRAVEGWPVADVIRETGKRQGAIYQAIYRVRNEINKEYQSILKGTGAPPEGDRP